ncbi:MAG: DUF3107 domain-containing protein [Acidimicrobiales bacterium]
MDVRIGIAETSQVIEIEMADDADRDAIKKLLDGALAGSDKVLWLIDRRGKEYAIPAGRISFAELSSAQAERRIGFGA